jgi:SAM-dependent methyltransferase
MRNHSVSALPCNSYLVQHNNRSGSLLRRLQGVTQHAALYTPKQHPGDTFNRYVESMANGAKGNKGQFFTDALTEYLPNSDIREHTVVDIGCCSGKLLLRLKKEFKHSKNIVFKGIDLNAAMIAKASTQKHLAYPMALVRSFLHKIPILAKLAGEKQFEYIEGHSDDILNRKGPLITVAILSSILHEIFSYGEKPFSKDNVVTLIVSLYEKLKPGGMVLLRDPVKPANPDELLILKLNTQDGQNFERVEDCLKVAPKDLSTASLFRRFTKEFAPASTDNYPVTAEGVSQNVPAWLVYEFLRHRVWAKTDEDWASELKEQYGSVTVEELTEIVETAGFSIEKLELGTKTDKSYYEIEGLMEIINPSNGKPIDLSERMPLNMQVILKKH